MQAEMRRRGFLGTVASFAAVGRDVLAVPPDEGLHVRFLGSGSACWEREPRTSKIFGLCRFGGVTRKSHGAASRPFAWGDYSVWFGKCSAK